MCIHGLGHLSPLSPPPHFQAEPVLPSFVEEKTRHGCTERFLALISEASQFLEAGKYSPTSVSFLVKQPKPISQDLQY
jgi:hypothetical protein